MLMKIAKYVEKSLLKTNMQRNSFAHEFVLENTGKKEEVYDLTVEENHEYFANGVLVHNCIDSLRYLLNAANYHQVPMDQPLPEQELYKDRRHFRLHNDPSLKEDDLYGSIDSELFGDSNY